MKGYTTHMANLDCSPKYLESLILMRLMSGSDLNAHLDQKVLEGWVSLTGKDGLAYMPGVKTDQTTETLLTGVGLMSGYGADMRYPYCSLYGEPRLILALTM